MNEKILVTGASGFIGRYLIKLLDEYGYKVKAGIHNPAQLNIFSGLKNVEPLMLDILDPNSLNNAMKEVDEVYHLAALVSSHESRNNLNKINAMGTRNILECASENGVNKILYCSSTAVYGLLSKLYQPVNESIQPRAIEPYGYSKYLGELETIRISKREKIHSIIIRPVAVFGPDEHTPFGKKLREAAVSKILLAGKLQKRKFNFVHVEDVAAASIHLMQNCSKSGEIFNITVNDPVQFEDAFQSYLRILNRSKNFDLKTKLIASVSSIINNINLAPHLLNKIGINKFVFTIWQPGFDILYSSEKLLKTSFKFKWENFGEVILSCLSKS